MPKKNNNIRLKDFEEKKNVEQNDQNIDITELSNGINIINRSFPWLNTAHCVFMLDIGSRDEGNNEKGFAHLWEHMAFKGTTKRKAFHILNRLDSLGGELNAFTTKEKLCFQATVLDKHIEKAIEILSDITFNSTFPARELEREKGVILEEMSMYNDSPEESVNDDFEAFIFQNTSLAHNILGEKPTIKNATSSSLKSFVNNNLDTKKMAFSVVGNVETKHLKKKAEKYFNQFEDKKGTERKPVYLTGRKEQIKKISKNYSQTHCVIGSIGYSIQDEKRYALYLLTNILGGPGMNARLNMTIREKKGLAYTIESHYTPYIDTGLFTVYFASDPAYSNKCIQYILKEFKKLKEKPLTENQLNQAREQLIGQIAIAEENNFSLAVSYARSFLDLHRIDSIEKIFYKIRSITSDQIQKTACEILHEDQLYYLIYEGKSH